MELDNIKHVYLAGIGGIGMSGLARYFLKRGCSVSGYDRTATGLTDRLIDEGADVVFVDSEAVIPDEFRASDPSKLVIYTPAMPAGSALLNYFRQQGFDVMKRSQVLGMISRGMFTIAVAGTHGKTTTSCMIAHILKDTGYDCSAFLGGIAANYQANVLFGENNVVVVEADEYDRSFLTLHPDIAVITSMDADHLDIYGDKEQLTESFRLFASQVKPGGTLLHRANLDLEGGITYAANETAAVYADHIQIREGDFYFDIISPEGRISDIRAGIPGLHNIENAVAAAKTALLLGIDPGKIKQALESFKGVKRRFEYIVKNEQHTYIDDYAHHPEELRACLTAVKSLYPSRKLTTIFQPHLFSRTRDFVEGFAGVLAMTDELILLDIYPARELPIPGITSQWLLDKIAIGKKQLCSKAEALQRVKDQQPGLLLTVGAGDIDTLVEPLKDALGYA